MACGDGEYIIYTALSFRNKAFGQALEFVWSADSAEYAIRESSSSIKLFRNFKERKALKPDSSAEGILFILWLGGIYLHHISSVFPLFVSPVCIFACLCDSSFSGLVEIA